MTSRALRGDQLLREEDRLYLVEHVLRLARVLLRIHDARSIPPEQVQVVLEVALVEHARQFQHLRLTMRNQHSRPVLPALAHHDHPRVEFLRHRYASLPYASPTQKVLEQIHILQGVLLQHALHVLRLTPPSHTHAQLLREAVVVARHVVDVDRLLAVVVRRDVVNELLQIDRVPR